MRTRRCLAVLLLAAFGAASLASQAGEAPLPEPFRVIAHRGASSLAPENTLPAFRRALAVGAREVELDVQLSSDDQVVLFHDATLDRKTELSGAVREHHAVTLRQAEIGTWFDAFKRFRRPRFAGTHLITLDQLFEDLGDRLVYHIELKSTEEVLPSKVLDVVRRFDLMNHVVLTSFHVESLERARRLAPDVPIGLLIEEAPDLADPPVEREALTPARILALQRPWVSRAKRAGFQQVGVPARDLSREIVTFAHARGLELRVWGVRSDEDAERAIALGTNGMTTDWPGRVLRRLAERAAPRGD